MKGFDTANVEDAYITRYDAVRRLLKGPDVIEGPMALAQKRKPNWSGE